MRRGRVIVLAAAVTGLLSALLAVAVNVATGGHLPGPLRGLSWLAWPAVGLLTAASVGLAVWQQLVCEPGAAAVDPLAAGRPAPQRVRADQGEGAAGEGLSARHPDAGQSGGEQSGAGQPGGEQSGGEQSGAGQSGAGPPAELPVAPPALPGRAHDLAEIEQQLSAGCPVLVLAGPPGVGKTSLAVRLAHGLRPEYPDGQLFADLRGGQPQPPAPEAVLSRFLAALGAAADERRGRVDALSARLRSIVADRRVLVVLDDAQAPEQVLPLLPGGAGCLTIITSRHLLPGLPGAATVPLGPLSAEAALAVLARETGEERIAADRPGAERIVELCGGLPLAVRIAGARLRSRPQWTPAALADLLSDERSRLDELRIGDVAVRSSLATSYAELSEVDRLGFRRAGSHPGPEFGVAAAAALTGLPQRQATAILDRLVDAQLVGCPAPRRYRLHDLTRLFATERFEAEETPGDQEASLLRLLGWLTGAAEAGAWLEQELDNVVAAVRRAVRAEAYEPAWELVVAVDPLLTAGADHIVRLALWQQAEIAATTLGDEARRARALRLISLTHRNAGEIELAQAPARESVAIAERIAEQTGDLRTLASSLTAYGEAARDRYRFAEAEAALRRAIELNAQLGDHEAEIEARDGLGTLYNTWWAPEKAVPVLERAAELLPATESRLHGWTYLDLAVAYKFTDRREAAREFIDRAIAVAGRVGDDYTWGYGHAERAWLANEDGRPDDALADLERTLATFQRIRHGTGVGIAYESIGLVAASAGRNADALAALDAAIVQFERVGDVARVGRVRLLRAVALAEVGRVAEAEQERDEAERIVGDLEMPELARARDRLAGLLRQRG